MFWLGMILDFSKLHLSIYLFVCLFSKVGPSNFHQTSMALNLLLFSLSGNQKEMDAPLDAMMSQEAGIQESQILKCHRELWAWNNTGSSNSIAAMTAIV